MQTRPVDRDGEGDGDEDGDGQGDGPEKLTLAALGENLAILCPDKRFISTDPEFNDDNTILPIVNEIVRP